MAGRGVWLHACLAAGVAAAVLGGEAAALGAPGASESAVAISGRTHFPTLCGLGEAPMEDSEVEPSVAVNPANPANVVAAWQQDRYEFGGGALSNVVAHSQDGGRTWAEVTVPGISRCTGGPDDRATDPWVTAGPDGTVYLATLSLSGGDVGSANSLLVSRSRDGGRAWSAPVVLGASMLWDKETLTADPVKPGHAYLAWTERVSVSATAGRLSRTTDGGETWSTPTVINATPTFTIGHEIAVLPDGTLIDSYVERLIQGDETLGQRVMVTRSTDAGTTWSPPAHLGVQGANPADPEDGKIIAGASLPSNAAGRDGRAYVAWGQIDASGSSRILVARSDDGGASWSEPLVVAKMSAQAFQPAVDVMPDGTVGVAWYDLRDDVRGDAPLTTRSRLAHSHDAGATWHEVTTGPWFDMREAPQRGGQYFPGDYREIAAFPDGFGTVWSGAPPVAASGAADIWFARVRVGETPRAPTNEPSVGRPRLSLSVRPTALRAGRRQRLRISVTAAGQPAAGVSVRCSGVARRTNRRGRVTLSVRIRKRGRARVRATKPGFSPGAVTLPVR